MSFFDSELVRAELSEISMLQEDIYMNVFNFSEMNKEERLFHISLLEKLTNKQQILYTRLRLSDDPEAIEMKERIHRSIEMMGFPTDADVNSIFNNMNKLIECMKDGIDKMG
jgi:hypothetical protein